jgi:hypothetical protein
LVAFSHFGIIEEAKMRSKERDDEESAKSYLDERKLLIDAEQKSAEQFDKGILTLAAGALGISLVFIKDIAPHPKPATLWFLVSAWAGFGVSLVSTLTSFLTSVHALRRQRDILDAIESKQPTDGKNSCATMTKGLNFASIFFFIAGAVCLAFFSIVNITQQGVGNEQRANTATQNKVSGQSH